MVPSIGLELCITQRKRGICVEEPCGKDQDAAEIPLQYRVGVGVGELLGSRPEALDDRRRRGDVRGRVVEEPGEDGPVGPEIRGCEREGCTS